MVAASAQVTRTAWPLSNDAELKCESLSARAREHKLRGIESLEREQADVEQAVRLDQLRCSAHRSRSFESPQVFATAQIKR